MLALSPLPPLTLFFLCFFSLPLIHARAPPVPGGAQEAMENAMTIQREGLERLRSFLGPDPSQFSSDDGDFDKRQGSESPDAAVPPPTITFRNPEAAKFFVDGSRLPLGEFFSAHFPLCGLTFWCHPVPFDAGPSWSGLMPISGAKNETRKLFFWCALLGPPMRDKTKRTLQVLANEQSSQRKRTSLLDEW